LAGWAMFSGQSLAFARGWDGQVVRTRNSCWNPVRPAPDPSPWPRHPRNLRSRMVRGRGLVPHALPIEALSLERNLSNFQRSRPNTAGVIPGARHCRPGPAWIAAGPVGPGLGLAGSFFRPIPIVSSPLGVVCGPDSKLGRGRVLAGRIRVIGPGRPVTSETAGLWAGDWSRMLGRC
jgi:hypothetical protein